MNTREELNNQLDAAGETPETRAEGAPESFMEAADLHCYGIELDLYSLDKMVWRGGDEGRNDRRHQTAPTL